MSYISYFVESHEVNLRMRVAEMLANTLKSILYKEAYDITQEPFNRLLQTKSLRSISGRSTEEKLGVLIPILYDSTEPLASEFIRTKESALETA